MPNHVMNILTIKGSEERVREILEEIKDEEVGYGSIDFNKIEPMPKELEIECGSATNDGLKHYKDFVFVYTAFAKRTKDELLNIPEEKEEIFLKARKDELYDRGVRNQLDVHRRREYKRGGKNRRNKSGKKIRRCAFVLYRRASSVR